jgi:signal transduction histidine kinase
MGQKDELERMKNDLVGMIAHKVRTPMAIMKEGLSLVLDEIPGKLNEEQRKMLTTVKNNADRLVNSVEEILKNPSDAIKPF